MTINLRSVALVAACVGLAFVSLGGCDSTMTAPPDPLGPRYQATLLEGIALAKQGYPAFVAGVYGLSISEAWGRWTDGDVAVFKFSQPLPKRFAVELSGGAFSGNIGKPIKLRVGPVEREVVFKDGPFENQSTQSADFTNEIGSDTLTILIPSAVIPAGPDGRRLGLALTALRIVEK